MSDMSQAPASGIPDNDTGQTDALVLSGREQIADACLRLASASRRELLILSRNLDGDLYDRQPFLAEVRRLCLAVPQAPVRVLVFDPRAPVLAGHRLIGIARQLSSRIAIRRVGEEFRDRTDAFLIADGRGYCLRRLADEYEAFVGYDAPAEAARLKADFTSIWERSDEDTELRRLYL